MLSCFFDFWYRRSEPRTLFDMLGLPMDFSYIDSKLPRDPSKSGKSSFDPISAKGILDHTRGLDPWVTNVIIISPYLAQVQEIEDIKSRSTPSSNVLILGNQTPQWIPMSLYTVRPVQGAAAPVVYFDMVTNGVHFLTNGAVVVSTSRHTNHLYFYSYFKPPDNLFSVPFSFLEDRSVDYNYQHFITCTSESTIGLKVPRFDHNGDYVFKWVFWLILLQYIDGERRLFQPGLKGCASHNEDDYTDPRYDYYRDDED